MTPNNKIYLPGLNGVRAIAALSVVISHTNGRLNNFGLQKLPYWDLAGFGVTIFFTLSGFLITFLLLKEIEKRKTINIRKFYARRILRIWPLYYFYLIVILLIFGYSNLGKIYLMYLFILPNVANAFATYHSFPWTLPAASVMFVIGHYWSLGVEEQFYSFWPFLVKKVKRLFLFLLLFPIFFLFVKLLAKGLGLPNEVQFILHYSRFGCLGIGGLGAYLFWKKYRILDYIKSQAVQLLPWLLLAIIAIGKFHIFSIIDHEIVSVFTVIFIVNQISGYKKNINLENRLFGYLGRISFGIYVYNPLAIYILYSLMKKPLIYAGTIYSYLTVYVLVMIFNVALAHISYFTLEKYFLNIKSKFTILQSVSNKKEYNETK